MLHHAETGLASEGTEYVQVRRWRRQVKTLAPGPRSDAYARTRRFYRSRGFRELEVFPDLWGAADPALQMIKAVR